MPSLGRCFPPKTFDLMSMASDGPQKRNMPARRERESNLFDRLGSLRERSVQFNGRIEEINPAEFPAMQP